MATLVQLLRRLVRHVPSLAVALLLPVTPLLSTAAPPQAAAAKPAAVGTAQATLRQRIEAAPEGIAGLHRRGSKPLDCAKCHGPGKAVVPDDNQTVENRECVACHGDYAQVSADLGKKNAGDQAARKGANKHVDPHASHLGPEIACTSCHQGHAQSKAYCLHCHTNFTMTMPGNRPAR